MAQNSEALTALLARSFLHTGLMLSDDHDLRVEGLAFLEKAVALKPDLAGAAEGLARGCVKRAASLRLEERLVEAEKILRRALALGSGIADVVAAALADILVLRAQGFVDVGGALFKAECLLREAIVLQPGLERAVALLAVVEAASREAGQEDLVAQEAALRRGGNADDHLRLADNLNQQAAQCFSERRFAEAECALRQALALYALPVLEDSLAIVLCETAVEAFNAVRLAEAETLLWEVLALRPEQAMATQLMAHVTGAVPRYVHNLTDPAYAPIARELRKALCVRDVTDAPYVRKGGVADGGYVMVDRGLENTIVYSLGIGDNVSWDLDMARLGCQIFQYDHTIDALPLAHENFHWSKLGVAGKPTGDAGFRTLDQLIDANGHRGQKDMILKVDIEAWEWEMFAEMPEETLCQFSQIVGEFHRLARIVDAAYRDTIFKVFEKINRHFQLVHAHANNFTGMAVIGGVPVYYCMELTFVRRSDHSFGDTKRALPTGMDYPCIPKLADLFLGGFVG